MIKKYFNKLRSTILNNENCKFIFSLNGCSRVIGLVAKINFVQSL